MSDPRVNGMFLSEKVSKIRWIPQQYSTPDSFVTGGWGSPESSVKLWKLISGDFVGGGGDELSEYIPKCTAEVMLPGDITGLEFVDANHIVVASSDGFVSVLQIDRNRTENNLTERYRYRNLHRFENGVAAACNGLAMFEHNVATIGEDGRLNVLATNQNRVIACVDEADSCSLTCVTFVNQKEVFTGNRMGLVKMFDVRSENKSAVSSFQISCDDDKKSNGVTSLTHHPTQKYILLSGSEKGSITVWDLRNLGYASSYLTAHDSAITELSFHPTELSKLFTASEAGELYQWQSQSSAHVLDGTVDGQLRYDDSDKANPWLSGDSIKNKISWTPLISGIRKSINSFDASGPKIISSCDNEAVYLIENVN